MPIDRFSFVPQQPIMNTYSPIDFGALGQLGAHADAKKKKALDELEGYYDAVLKVNAIKESPEDVAYVKQKRAELNDIINTANSTPNVGLDPYKTLDFVRKAREIHNDPNLGLIDSNYREHQLYLKNKEDASKKEWAGADEQQHAYKKAFQTYIGEGGFKKQQLGDARFQFGMDVRGESEKLFDGMTANEREYMAKLSTEQGGYGFSEKIKDISSLNISDKAKAGFRSFVDGQAGKQLRNRYDMQKDQGMIPQGISFTKYAVDYLNNTGAEKTFRAQSETGRADAFNKGLGDAKLLHGYLEPALMTKSEGSALKFSTADEFTTYSSSLQAKLTKTNQQIEVAKQPNSAVSTAQITALEQEKARLVGEMLNMMNTWKSISALPGDVDENFKKYSEDSFKAAKQNVPFGQSGIITDVHRNPHKTAAMLIQEGTLTNYADVLDISGKGEDESNKDALQKGRLSVKSLTFDRDNNPVLNAEVFTVGKNGAENKTATYDIKNVPKDILFKIANDNDLLAENYKNEASQVGPGDMGQTYLNEAKDHKQAARNIRNSVVNKFVNEVSSGVPQTQKRVTFDLGAVGIPGVKIEAARDGDNYTIEGVGTLNAQGLTNWISDNISSSSNK